MAQVSIRVQLRSRYSLVLLAALPSFVSRSTARRYERGAGK